MSEQLAIFLSLDGATRWKTPMGTSDPTWAPPFFCHVHSGTYWDIIGRCWGRPVYRERARCAIDP